MYNKYSCYRLETTLGSSVVILLPYSHKRLTHISTWREKSCKIEQNTKKVSSSVVCCTSYCVCDSSYTVLPCQFLSSVQYMFLVLRFGHLSKLTNKTCPTEKNRNVFLYSKIAKINK